MLTPYEWQLKDLDTLRDHDYTGLLSISAGGGKTISAALVIKDLDPEVVLVVAPKSTHRSAWGRVVPELTGRDVRVVGNGSKAEKSALADLEWSIPGVYACTPQFMARYAHTDRWSGDLLVVDEIHQSATHGSKGQRVLSGSHPSDRPLSERFAHRLALSGTPMRQAFSNMWATMRFLWPENDNRFEVADYNFWRWENDRMTKEIVHTTRKDENGKTETATNFIAEKDPGKLWSEMPCVVVHHRREKCCDAHPHGFLDTPEPQEIERVVALTPKQKKIMRDLETSYMTWLEDGPLVTELPIVMQQRLRQVCLGEPTLSTYEGQDKDGNPVEKTRIEFATDCKSPFLDATIDILDELPDDEPVVVFLESQRFARVVVERLNKRGVTAQEYSGKAKADLDRFGTDYRVLVGVVSAIGTGTDGIQSRCKTEIWLETPVSLTAEDQAKARLDRLGGSQVQRYLVLDTDGYSRGRLSDNIVKRLAINASMRRGE